MIVSLIIIATVVHVLVSCFVLIDGYVYWFDPTSVGLKETQKHIYDFLGITKIVVILLIPLVLVISIPLSFYVYWLFLKWLLSKKVSR